MGPKKKTELTISRYACGWECDGSSDESKKKKTMSQAIGNAMRNANQECESSPVRGKSR